MVSAKSPVSNMIRETFFQEYLIALKHIHSFRHYEDRWDVPRDITNKGIKEYLQCGKEKSGIICGWLVQEGWITPKLKHIIDEPRRLITYYPTQKANDELASPMADVNPVEPVIKTYPAKWIWNNRSRKWVWLT